MDLATLLEGPALAPPENVMPDFTNPGGAHDLGYGVIIACAVMATLSVVMRLATRIAMRKLGMADAMYFCALVGLTCGAGKAILRSILTCTGMLRRSLLCNIRRLDLPGHRGSSMEHSA